MKIAIVCAILLNLFGAAANAAKSSAARVPPSSKGEKGTISHDATIRDASYSKDAFMAAAKSAKIGINEDQLFTISRGKDRVIAAPSVEWARIPASELKNGVTFGIAYIESRDMNVPRGYYTLRIFADGSHLGTVDGKVQLIDSKGKVAGERPARVRINSLTVPANASGENFITTGSREADEHTGMVMFLWFHCINGQCINMTL
jgi:hypothetical protein